MPRNAAGSCCARGGCRVTWPTWGRRCCGCCDCAHSIALGVLQLQHTPGQGPGIYHNFSSRHIGSKQTRERTRLCYWKPGPGGIWWFDAATSRYNEKHGFGDVTETAFSSYLRFAAMFEQAELRGIQMGPNGPPNAKKPLKSPQKSIF